MTKYKCKKCGYETCVPIQLAFIEEIGLCPACSTCAIHPGARAYGDNTITDIMKGIKKE